MNAVADAKQVLAKLQGKLAYAHTREAEIREESKSVTFDAFTSAGPAKKRLDDLHKERIAITLEVEGLTIAIDMAETHVADALAAERRADGIADAKAMQQELPVFIETARAMSKAAQEWEDGCDTLSALVRSFAARGVPISQRLCDVQIDRALKTVVDPRSVAPNERHRLEDLTEVWARGVQALINDRLGEPADKGVKLPTKEKEFA